MNDPVTVVDVVTMTAAALLCLTVALFMRR